MISSSTDDGYPIRCSLCGMSSVVNLSQPPGDSVCPSCGTHLWVDAVSELTCENHFDPTYRIPTLPATTRNEAIDEITGFIADQRNWNRELLAASRAAVLHRESLGSTAVGRGVAVPHASIAQIDSAVSVIAYVPNGLDFDSLDGDPVFTIILLLSDQQNSGDHLRTLERISRSLRYFDASRPCDGG